MAVLHAHDVERVVQRERYCGAEQLSLEFPTENHGSLFRRRDPRAKRRAGSNRNADERNRGRRQLAIAAE